MKRQNRILVPAILIGAAVIVIAAAGYFILPRLLSRTAPNLADSSGIHVNPVDGLRPDFIMGADLSMLDQIEQSGGKYFVNGKDEDALTVFKDAGVNWIRLRIWNDPTDAQGVWLGGGNNDLQKTIAVASRAKKMGFKFLLDFHYSDWWADPGKQNKPKAWADLHGAELEKAVYDYTANVIQKLAAAGARPDMVEIGNEINDGILWPDGKISKVPGTEVGGYDGLAALLSQGIRAVRDNDPNAGNPAKKIKILLHLANGGDNALFKGMFDALTARKVDYDVIGLSYYSYWHGTLNALRNNMNDISKRYQKDVVIAEAAYAFTLDDADSTANLFTEGQQIPGGYLATIQGQANAIRDVIFALAKVPNGRGLGIFYWEPDWIPVAGAGWQTGAGDTWDNQAMFDFQGNALPSLNVFNLVWPKPGRETTTASIVKINPAALTVPLGEVLKLPATVKAIYTDDSIRGVTVAWEKVDPAKLQTGGTFTLNGAVAGTDIPAVLEITVNSEKNFALNPGFEDGKFDPWTVTGDSAAADVRSETQNVHDGDYAMHYWLDTPFAFTVSQTMEGLADGLYTLSAWIHGGGGEKVLQLFAVDCGGGPRSVDIVNTGWQEWKNPTIPDIQVAGGKCTIGLKVASDGGSWGFLDQVSFTLQ